MNIPRRALSRLSHDRKSLLTFAVRNFSEAGVSKDRAVGALRDFTRMAPDDDSFACAVFVDVMPLSVPYQ